MRAISKEKRELLTEAKERGETTREIALWLGISSSSVALIWKQYKTRGHVRPTKNKGRPPRHRANLQAGLPDCTQVDVMARLPV
jgi:transposase